VDSVWSLHAGDVFSVVVLRCAWPIWEAIVRADGRHEFAKCRGPAPPNGSSTRRYTAFLWGGLWLASRHEGHSEAVAIVTVPRRDLWHSQWQVVFRRERYVP
jgi:hypothetical protein